MKWKKNTRIFLAVFLLLLYISLKKYLEEHGIHNITKNIDDTYIVDPKVMEVKSAHFLQLFWPPWL